MTVSIPSARPATLEELALELEYLGVQVVRSYGVRGPLHSLLVTFDRTRALSVDEHGGVSLIAGFADYYFTLTPVVWDALALIASFRERLDGLEVRRIQFHDGEGLTFAAKGGAR